MVWWLVSAFYVIQNSGVDMIPTPMVCRLRRWRYRGRIRQDICITNVKIDPSSYILTPGSASFQVREISNPGRTFPPSKP